MSNPTQVAGIWTFPKDPDDIRFYWGNISQDLLDMGTTASSVTEIVAGVAVATSTIIVIITDQTWLKVKLSGLDVSAAPSNFCTFRVVCANGEQFDRTINFVRENH